MDESDQALVKANSFKEEKAHAKHSTYSVDDQTATAG